MNKSELFNSIFFPRPSFIEKDEKDHLVDVENEVQNSRSFLYSQEKHSILDEF